MPKDPAELAKECAEIYGRGIPVENFVPMIKGARASKPDVTDEQILDMMRRMDAGLKQEGR